MQASRHAIIFPILAFSIWGIFPLLFKQIYHIPASETVTHRIMWSFVVYLFLTIAIGKLALLKSYCTQINQNKVQLLWLLGAAILIFLNWFIYVIAINIGKIVEAGMGYYINPLMSVLLGALFFGERLNRLQSIAVGIATCAVLYLVAIAGYIPWIALTLAITFASYGLVKKKIQVHVIVGNVLESALLLPLALIYFGYLEYTGDSHFLGESIADSLWLMALGAVTALPLLLFAAAAQRLPLSVIGITQYTTPTLQVLIGVFIYGEAFSQDRKITFALILMALGIYIYDSLYRKHKSPPIPTDR